MLSADTTPRRLVSAALAAYAAASWLAVLTSLNMATGGAYRATILFAIPVCFTAWHSWRAGCVFAAVAVTCAWLGGAMPEPNSPVPLWVDALEAFAKLSIDAAFVNVLDRRRRARAQDRSPRRDSGDD